MTDPDYKKLMLLSEQNARGGEGIKYRTARDLAELRQKREIDAEESRALAKRFQQELLAERLGHEIDPLPNLEDERPYAWEEIGNPYPFGADSLPPASISQPYPLPPEAVDMGFTRQGLDEQHHQDMARAAERKKFLEMTPEERFAEQMLELRQRLPQYKAAPPATYGTFKKASQ
jgi:hypothetical protein